MRGCPSAPGLMLSLDHGGECWGVVMRMKPDDLSTALTTLLKLEPPCPPEWVEADTEAGIVPAIAFTACPDFLLYQPEPAIEAVADALATAVGHVGSMADYLLNTIIHLEEAGIHDPHLWRLQDMVAERLERLV
jgi:cation transport protein ChaC